MTTLSFTSVPIQSYLLEKIISRDPESLGKVRSPYVERSLFSLKEINKFIMERDSEKLK